MSWPLVALEDVAPSSPIKLEEYGENKNIWQITLDHIESNTGRLLKKSIKPLSEIGSSTHAFDDRHVLYSKLRPYLNKVLLPDEIGVGTTELVPMLPDSDKLDRNYLAHYLKSKNFVNWISSQTAGAKMPRVSMKVFWGHKIPLPPLEEQKRIAAILDKADAVRRKRQQAIDLSNQLLRSVFLDMFGDPVTNSMGWNVAPLKGAIIHANNGMSRRRKTSENVGGIVLRLQDVHYDGIRFEKDLSRIQLDEKEKQRYKLDNNDILFIRVNGNPNYVGRSAVFHSYNEDVYHNDHIIRIKLSGGYAADFLCYLINYSGSRNIISPQLKTSAGQHTISQGGIEKLKFYLPPIDLQVKFVEIMKKINETRAIFRGYEKEIGDLFSSLTQQAFSGELTKQTEAA